MNDMVVVCARCDRRRRVPFLVSAVVLLVALSATGESTSSESNLLFHLAMHPRARLVDLDVARQAAHPFMLHSVRTGERNSNGISLLLVLYDLHTGMQNASASSCTTTSCRRNSG
jgi:hypothetical protein